MAPERRLNLPAVRKHSLLTEFYGLKYGCPQGLFMSLTPGDPTLWSGVLFVKKGPYSPSVLRFQISFPPSYPELPPLIIFSTEIFHPLVTPLTTYMYTTDIQDSGTVSATDEERLPPGGFSLRHGFPEWVGRRSKRPAYSSRQTSAQHLQTPAKAGSGVDSGVDTPESGKSGIPTPGPAVLGSPDHASSSPERIATYDVLRYVKSAFDDATVLDNVPLEAAGNPGAWHAWRAHRVKLEMIAAEPPTKVEAKKEDGAVADEERPSSSSGNKKATVGKGGSGTKSIAKQPGDWDWSGVWEVRVKKGIENSTSEPVLFGNAVVGDDMIRFLNMDKDQVDTIKENIKRSVDALASS